MNTSDYQTLVKTTRYWLLGKAENSPEYYQTLQAFEIAMKYHKGIRKDGVTKELYHQLNIFSMLRTQVATMLYPSIVLSVALLHDTYEDYEESHNELFEKFPEIMVYVVRISKVRNGQKIPYEQYFGEMSECPITSLVKIVDRIHNLSTMHGVFSLEKEASYVQDVYDYFYPMLKTAKRNFPQQEAIYETLKSILSLQVNMIETRTLSK